MCVNRGSFGGDLLPCPYCKGIHTFIIGMTSVPLDPVEAELVSGLKYIEFFPQLLIFHRFFVCGTPAPRLPPLHPLRQAFQDVLAVGMQGDTRRAGQGLKAFDDSGEFHAVVGGVGFAARILVRSA